ncbi:MULTISPECIES: cysteine desulfurase family protein [unclassified Enterococcus]|uniref:cysteine desulfurase family protein n=1 Tax=unclassified Enterococcus TaxID=2608891 RepID=UPI001552CA84|nr:MULTISPECIES: cysteine desulfurase family protein [unclassified Enterococcus]MBS7576174.1 cysteine desulfurase [Enterococcus sp. MMGLQ5-2]MBS7583407.1 cysteine desulfurase [Enterococcus sp. MMGLQ5-1]NPD11267.1 cysteine desulfurase [Enterococcus sp. MMGLQ5-1]NPD36010.1 cysteine desulfurase [Enterococcus sp. MMGLQ5-2]
MIYFDNSATTQIYPESLKAYMDTASKVFGNPSSLHRLGSQAHRLLEMAREQIADLFAVQPKEIYFTSGGTEGNNWIIKGTALAKHQFGNHIIISNIEHASVRNAAESLSALGFEIDYLPVDADGFIQIDQLEGLIKPTTILVSVMAVNNEIGSIQPIEAISEILNDYPKIQFHVDAVQAISKLSVNEYLNSRVDFLTVSAHKFHGPRGVGFIYAKSGKKLQPLLDGGGQESAQRSTTENLAGIVAMAKALRLSFERQADFMDKVTKQKQLLVNALSDFDKVRVFSPATAGFIPTILTLGLPGVRGEVLVHALEEREIFVSTTSACYSKRGKMPSTLGAMGVRQEIAESAIRLSFGEQNTIAEVEQFMLAFRQAYVQFERVTK